MDHIIAKGRIVHFVNHNGKCRPAIIVDDLGNSGESEGPVNLQVFTDGGNDQLANVMWETSITHDDTGQYYTYHWHDECQENVNI